MMDEMMKDRKKKALQVTVSIPLDGGEPEIIKVEPEEESEMPEMKDESKDDEKKGLAPDLEDKKDYIKGHESELMRKKKAGIKPKSLDEKAMIEMVD